MATGKRTIISGKTEIRAFGDKAELGLDRVGYRGREHFGRALAGIDLVVDRTGIDRRRGARLALLGEQRAAKVRGKIRCGLFGQGLAFALVRRGQIEELGLDFLVTALGGGARDDARQQAAEPAAAGAFFLLRFERLDLDGRAVIRRDAGLDRFGHGDAEMGRDDAPDHLGLGQAAIAELATGHRAFVGLQHSDTCRSQQRDIALRRLVLPHPHIHGRHGDHRLVGGKDQRRRQIIGNPARHLGEQIGRRRAHHHQIGLAAQLDMAHLGLVLEVEQVGVDLIFR